MCAKKSSAPRLKVVGEGFEDLKAIAGSLKLAVPKLGAIPSLDSLGSSVEERVSVAKGLEKDIPAAAGYIVAVRKMILPADRLERKFMIADTMGHVKKMEAYLSDVLSLEDVIFRQVAAVAYLTAVLSQDFKTVEEVSSVLEDLNNRQLLVKASNGPIFIGYQRYQISDKFGLEEEDLKAIGEVVAQFARRRLVIFNQQRQSQLDKAKQDASLSTAEFLQGGEGKCIMEVLAESFLDENGGERWRGGGQLCVDVTAQEVIPILGIGSLEPIVNTMVQLKVRLPRNLMERDSAPSFFELKKLKTVQDLQLDDREIQEHIKKMQVLWHLVDRAIKPLEDQEKMEEIKEDFCRKSTISPAQFFGLTKDPAEGIACLAFKGTFYQDGKPSIYNLFFLATITKDDGIDIVEVVEVPEHLQDFLGKFVGKKYPAKDNFLDFPKTLGRVLRGIRSSLDIKAEMAKD